MNKLLVVDDDADLLEITARRLKRKGFDVLTASNLSEARAHCQENINLFRGIVCDLFLESENGISFYEELKKNGLNCKFVLATGDDSGDIRIEKYLLDSDFLCLQKPFELNVLLNILKINAE